MTALGTLSRAFAVLAGLVAVCWFILPWWQVAAGMADGVMPFVVCTLFGFIFSSIGIGLYFCYRKTRSGEMGLLGKTMLWSFVTVSALIVSAMVLRIVWVFVPFRV
jgi:hypothetical protein